MDSIYQITAVVLAVAIVAAVWKIGSLREELTRAEAISDMWRGCTRQLRENLKAEKLSRCAALEELENVRRGV